MSPKPRPFGKLMLCLVSLVLVAIAVVGTAGCGSEDEGTD